MPTQSAKLESPIHGCREAVDVHREMIITAADRQIATTSEGREIIASGLESAVRSLVRQIAVDFQGCHEIVDAYRIYAMIVAAAERRLSTASEASQIIASGLESALRSLVQQIAGNVANPIANAIEDAILDAVPMPIELDR